VLVPAPAPIAPSGLPPVTLHAARLPGADRLALSTRVLRL